MVTLPFEARNEVLFINVGFANRPENNVSRSQPLIFYRQKLWKRTLAKLKNLFSLICGFRIPVSDSGFWFPAPDFGFWFPVSRF